jgi:K+-transporting ATPase ATPase C chain
VDGKARGSSLVAQPFSDTRYFQARPSAAGYDPMSASGSNQARTNPQLRQRIRETQLAVAQREGVALAEVPKDLISQSGSGLDPHISVQAALIQANRVANARAIPRADIVSMINQYTEGKQLGVLGQARVNVLKLNMALDSYSKRL